MHKHNRLAIFAVLLLGLLYAVPVCADDGRDKTNDNSTSSKKRRAKRHFNRAEVYYQQGEFRKALKEYRQVHRLSRHADMIFNMAQCHRQLGEYKKALFSYKLFLAENADAANKKEVLQLIDRMKKKLAEKEQEKKRKGRVSVITQPAGASILIDKFTGIAVATSPSILKLMPGEHIVVVKRKGYKLAHKTVKVVSAKLVTVSIKLTPVKKNVIARHPARAKGTAEKAKAFEDGRKKTERKDKGIEAKERKAGKRKGKDASAKNAVTKKDDRSHPHARGDGNANKLTRRAGVTPKKKTRQRGQTRKESQKKKATAGRQSDKNGSVDREKDPGSLDEPLVASASEQKPEKSKDFYETWWFWTGVSVSFALAGGAAATAYLTMSAREKWFEGYNERDKKRGETLGVVTDGLWGAAAGIAVAVTVGAFVFHYRGGRSKQEKQTAVLPSCSGQGCGVLVQGRF
jgi:hypothetical protein